MEKRALQEKFITEKVLHIQRGLAESLSDCDKLIDTDGLFIQNKLVKLVEDAQKSVEVVLIAEKEAREVMDIRFFHV